MSFVGPWANETLNDLASRARAGWRILLTGEFGTGRRTLARALHQRLHSSAGAIIEQVVVGEPESTYRRLFGEEGRSAGHAGGLYWPGAVERAHGGTVLVAGIERADDRLAEAIRLWLEEGRTAPSGGDERRVGTVACFATLEGEAAPPAARLVSLFDHVLRVKPLRERPADAEACVRAEAEDLPPEAARHLAAGSLFGNYPELARLIEEEARLWRGLSPAEKETRLAEMRAAKTPPVELLVKPPAPTPRAAGPAGGAKTKKDILLDLASTPECARLTLEEAAARAGASVSYAKKILRQAGIDLPQTK